LLAQGGPQIDQPETDAMGILYNANLTPPMNDSSVTSGNADGWVYAVATNFDAIVIRPAADKSLDGRSAPKARKHGKRKKG
jgi:hypothetical protein